MVAVSVVVRCGSRWR